MNWLNTQVLKLFQSVKLYHVKIITAALQASMLSRVCLVTSAHHIGFLLSYSHCCILLTLSIRNRSARYMVTGAGLTSHNDKRDIVVTGEIHYLTTGVYPWYRAWYLLRRVIYSLQSFLLQILIVAVLITTVMASGYPLPPPPGAY